MIKKGTRLYRVVESGDTWELLSRKVTRHADEMIHLDSQFPGDEDLPWDEQAVGSILYLTPEAAVNGFLLKQALLVKEARATILTGARALRWARRL